MPNELPYFAMIEMSGVHVWAKRKKTNRKKRYVATVEVHLPLYIPFETTLCQMFQVEIIYFVVVVVVEWMMDDGDSFHITVYCIIVVTNCSSFTTNIYFDLLCAHQEPRKSKEIIEHVRKRWSDKTHPVSKSDEASGISISTFVCFMLSVMYACGAGGNGNRLSQY
jgi:hypothetical protein